MLRKRTQWGKGANTEGDRVFLLVMALGYAVEGAAHIRVYRKIAGVHRKTVAKLIGQLVKKLLTLNRHLFQ
jgi:hypothetical protein